MTPRQTKAIEALLKSPTKAEAARLAGIAESTLRTYWKDPEFVSEYKARVSCLMEEGTRAAQKAVPSAVRVLLDVAEDEEQSAASRVSACRSLLEYALKLSERLEVIERITALEAKVKEGTH